MKQDMVKIQFDIPRPLAEALWAAAAKDLRTHKAFLTRLIQDAPSVRDFILKSASTENVKIPQADVVSLPVAPKPVWPPVPVKRVDPGVSPEEAATMTPEQLAWRKSPEFAKLQGWT